MNVTQNVIHDLLPAYLAGDASADTVALVEEFLRNNPDLARTVEALRANPLPEASLTLPPTHEKEILNMTKQLLRWRGILMGLAISLSLLPLSFRFDNDRITWTFLHDAPNWLVPVIAAAGTCWAGFLYVNRRLKSTGI